MLFPAVNGSLVSDSGSRDNLFCPFGKENWELLLELSFVQTKLTATHSGKWQGFEVIKNKWLIIA